MVARSEDKPRTVTERLNETSQRLDEAVRAQGRGAPALRDSAGNVLEMNADAPYPLLTPQGVDAAVAFDANGTVRIVSADATSDGKLSSGVIYASAELGAQGAMTAYSDFYCYGTAHTNALTTTTIDAAGNITAGASTITGATVTSTGFTFVGGGLKVGDAYDTVGGRITSRELTTVGNMACDGTFYYKNMVNNSDERLKYKFEPLPGSALEAMRDVDWQTWEYLPDPSTEPRANRRHAMATAQALQANPVLNLVVNEEQAPGTEESDILSVSTSDLLGIACAALREAGDEIAELRRQLAEVSGGQIAELKKQLADVSTKLDKHLGSSGVNVKL